MKYRPSRGLVLCLTPLLATATAGAWAWNKANDAPLRERAGGDFVNLLKRDNSGAPHSMGTEEWEKLQKASRAECRTIVAKLRADFPSLQIEPKPVPAEENAFLQLHLLSGPPIGNGPRIGRSLQEILASHAEWNAEAVKAALAEHAEVVAKVEHIAALESRSSSEMPESYNGFVGARAAKTCADILLLKARLAAEAKDEAEALRLVAATRNLARHFREIEEPTLLAETVAILIDLSVANCAFEHLLPKLGRDADLPQWKQALGTRGYTPADFAQVMRGEWNVVAEFYLAPVVLKQAPSDGDELMQIHASNFAALVAALPGMSWGEFTKQRCEPLQEGFSHLSEQSRGIAKEFFIGCKAWTKGYVRAASVLASHQAALNLMMLEKAGENLDGASVEKIMVEPVSGTRFSYDPKSRTLSPPESMKEFEVGAVKLPW